MDSIDRSILNILQFSFPLVIEPYLSIARSVGLTQREVINRISKLKKLKIIRQISPIFDSSSIGYHSTLAAFKVKENHVEEVARILNNHPGISHNYLRNGTVNLWFTVTIPTSRNLFEEVKLLAKETGVSERYFLPTIKTYKIGFRLPMADTAKGNESVPLPLSKRKSGSFKFNRKFISIIQHDLPLVSRPYRKVSSILAISEGDIINELKRYIKHGAIRRVASVLNPVKSGFKSNIMVAWAPVKKKKELLGKYVSTIQSISHCYERPSSRKWPYSIYTMIHGSNASECKKVINDIRKQTGVNKFNELATLKEFKKRRVIYYP